MDRINSTAELKTYGRAFRNGIVASSKVSDYADHEYAETTEEFEKQKKAVSKSKDKETYSRGLVLQHHWGMMVSVSMTLDELDGKFFYHLSLVEWYKEKGEMKSRRVPDHIAHQLATNLAGPNWKEEPHSGTMIPDIRHFLSPTVELN
jgi:hypothetical protein